ncbi:20292_t:CDS:1, partial [Racocetra persica]
HENNLTIYEELNKGITKWLEYLDKKINNCLTLLRINFSDADINKIDKVVSASENLKTIQE